MKIILRDLLAKTVRNQRIEIEPTFNSYGGNNLPMSDLNSKLVSSESYSDISEMEVAKIMVKDETLVVFVE